MEWPVRRRRGRRRLGSFRAKRFRAPAITAASAASAASAWPCDQTVGRRKWLIRGEWWNRWRDGRVQLANGSVGTRRRGRLLLGQHHRKFSDVRICAPSWMRRRARIFRNAERTLWLRYGRVEMWRGGGRLNISVSASFVWRCLSGSALTPFPHPAHRTGHADFPHPALGQDFTPSPTARRAQAGTGVRAGSARKGARVDKPRPCVA